MYVVMGASGHVGSAVVDSLIRRGEAVTIVTRHPDRASCWRSKGVAVAVADADDPDSLRDAFERGRRAFLLNPPADVAKDTDAVERATVANILAALEGSGLEKVVAESTAGAQQGERIGDLSVLWDLEQGLRRQPIPAAINRAAYYMSNWDAQLDAIRGGAALSTMYPADLPLPMVAPEDLGRAAADRLFSPIDDVGIRSVEGPARYSSRDVANAFARALGRPVDVEVVARDRWHQAYRALGFSDAAADAYTRMTAASLDQGFDRDEAAIRGATTLYAYIAALVDRS